MSDTIEYQLEAERQLSEAETSSPVELMALGTVLVSEFAQAEADRLLTEQRWLKDIRQYKGQYDPEVEIKIGPNRSRAFVRKTRVKVKTADSRVMDLLFPAGSEKNWDVDSTPVPTLPDEVKAQIIQQLQAQAQGQPIPKEMVDKACLQVAKKAAKGMAKVIDDQLSEVRYKMISKEVVHSGHLYGTGILKGPLIEKKVRVKFVREQGKWIAKSEEYIVPFVDFVPVWRFYPDMSASQLDQCRYVYERHQMTRSDMANLASRKSFDRVKILDYLKANPSGFVKLRYFDNELKIIGDRTANQGKAGGQYEVLERWGWLTGDQLKEIGIKIDDDRCHESFFSNIWLLPDGTVIKAALQPINGVTWPYHLYYFDKDETSIFGEGLPMVMRDDQTMINAAVRLMLDNAAITSGAMLEVNPHLLHPLTKADEVFPWKVWLRNQTSPGEAAVKAINIPNGLQPLMALQQMFEANADEVSAIPRYMAGENMNQGAAGTSSGLSMLMGAVNIVIKDLITSWDEGVTRSFVTGMYRWNMQFNNDDAIKGDFDVKARGTASLIAKEVRARQLNEFGALTANPLDAPFINRHRLNLLRAEANELSDVVFTEDEVAEQQQGEQAQQQQQLAMRMQAAQLAELEGKAAKMMADAKVTQLKAGEVLANIDLTVSKSVSTKLEGIYAALQAAGVAVSNPMIAPAGDELLKSAGFKDATPDPAIAQLLGQKVQQAAGAQAPGMQAPMLQAPTAELEPATGMQGVRAGIETARIEQ